jgi:hypothetical protein
MFNVPPGMHALAADGVNAGEGEKELAALAVVLDLLAKKWPDQFTARDVAGVVNVPDPAAGEQMLRKHLLPNMRRSLTLYPAQYLRSG